MLCRFHPLLSLTESRVILRPIIFTLSLSAWGHIKMSLFPPTAKHFYMQASSSWLTLLFPLGLSKALLYTPEIIRMCLVGCSHSQLWSGESVGGSQISPPLLWDHLKCNVQNHEFNDLPVMSCEFGRDHVQAMWLTCNSFSSCDSNYKAIRLSFILHTCMCRLEFLILSSTLKHTSIS